MAIYVEWLKKQFQSSLESGDYTKTYQQLDEIEMIFQKLQRKGQTNIIIQFLEFFCNEWLLPIGSISENQYRNHRAIGKFQLYAGRVDVELAGNELIHRFVPPYCKKLPV